MLVFLFFLSPCSCSLRENVPIRTHDATLTWKKLTYSPVNFSCRINFCCPWLVVLHQLISLPSQTSTQPKLLKSCRVLPNWNWQVWKMTKALNVFCGTWNVNGKPVKEDLTPWLVPSQGARSLSVLSFTFESFCLPFFILFLMFPFCHFSWCFLWRFLWHFTWHLLSFFFFFAWKLLIA